MRTLVPEPVKSAHAYTRSPAPWRLETYRGASGVTTSGRKFGWKLFHYLAGGGMRAFGRTVAQDEADWRQSRFLRICGVLALIWLWFYF
ncbi:MAG TPA: hypothetical protein DER26_01720 [Verrucomicrobia bacterium]|nr:hypothetical protein [Verrucomicrobiota bacterium]